MVIELGDQRSCSLFHVLFSILFFFFDAQFANYIFITHITNFLYALDLKHSNTRDAPHTPTHPPTWAISFFLNFSFPRNFFYFYFSFNKNLITVFFINYIGKGTKVVDTKNISIVYVCLFL